MLHFVKRFVTLFDISEKTQLILVSLVDSIAIAQASWKTGFLLSTTASSILQPSPMAGFF